MASTGVGAPTVVDDDPDCSVAVRDMRDMRNAREMRNVRNAREMRDVKDDVTRRPAGTAR